MKLSLVIPFIDQEDITKHCIETAVKNAGSQFELVMIDNGSDKTLYPTIKKLVGTKASLMYLRNKENSGVLASFKQGFQSTDSDIVGFIHNDVLLHEENWVQRVIDAFQQYNIGLAGIFGAVGVGDNGGRIRSQSKMLGLEWGSCECHAVAWQHHSEYLEGVAPAVILDGVGMFFSREAANALIESDMFDDWRAPHHFYDRIMPLKLIDKGFRITTIGLGFDHWSGATANSNEKYANFALNWALDHKEWYIEGMNGDFMVYNAAEQQFFNEFGKRIPCYVNADWQYEWRGLV